MQCFPFLILGLSLTFSYVCSDYVTVDLGQNQQLRGSTKSLRNGEVVSIFKNIPFGASTAGDKRFAAPEEAPAWTGVRDALAFGGRCMQKSDAIDHTIFESEDCLNLNVYSPDINGSLPVMVFIHGGGFDSGSGSYFLYESSTLAARGVVVVTINYRLGAFGFLSTGDDVMPGNFGLLDQVLALKWVQKNIATFGGDPDEVTIFGESAGAACVSLHVLSPLSKGLFKKAIMESGAALSAWAVERPTTLVKLATYAKEIGSRVDCPQTDSLSLLACLRGVDARALVNASEAVQEDLGVSILANPRVETKFGFLPEYPEVILEKGNFQKVDTLRGYNSGEYSFVISDKDNDGITRDEFIDFFMQISENYAFENKSVDALRSLVEAEYLKQETRPLVLRDALIRGLTDILFAASEVLELDKLIAKGNPTSNHYLYQLNYIVESLLNVQSFLPHWMGAPHTGELPLVFVDDSAFAALLSTQAQKDVGNLVQTMWTNFAKYGEPTRNVTGVDWRPYSSVLHNMLVIDVASKASSYPSPQVIPLYEKILAVL